MIDKLTDMKRKDLTDRDERYFLIHKKGQFEALTDGLSKLNETALRRIAAFWLGSHDAMIEPLDKLQAKLNTAMSNPEQANRMLDRLPKRSYDLLFYILSEGSSLTVEKMGTNFPHDKKEDITSILRPMIIRGLIWECRSTVSDEQSARLYVLETYADILPLPSFLEGKYGTLLPLRSKEQLHNLVSALGEDSKSLTKGDKTLQLLKTAMRNPSRLRRFFDKLGINDRKLLKILALHSDGLTPEELSHEFTMFVNKDPDLKFKESLIRLQDEYGLIDVKIRELTGGRRKIKQAVYRLPREMSHLIRVNFKEIFQDVFPKVPIFVAPDEDFALGSRSKERLTLWIDFQQLLNHLVRCEVGVIRKGGMHKKNLKRILDRLEGQISDAYLYLDFLFLYAHQRNILYPDGERWKIDVKQILPIQNQETFYGDFWAFYRSNSSWNDRDSSPLQGVLQKGDLHQIFALRRAILRLINDCPVGQWIEMKSFYDQLCDREMAFRTGDPPLISNDPEKEKFRFMKSNLERSLKWIGIVDTTTIPSQRINLFRLTEIGAWLLKLDPMPSPLMQSSVQETIAMMPNLEIHIPDGFPIEKQLYLSRFTDDQKGRILLNRTSIRRGLADGLSVKEMQDFLKEHVQNDPPPNALHLLEEVGEKVGHVLIGGEPVRVEVQHHAVLDELMIQKRFLPYIGERSNQKQLFLKHDADLNKFVEELRKAGFTPRSI